MYWSAGESGEAPLVGEVTTTGPEDEPPGTVHVSEVELLTSTLVHGLPPTVTVSPEPNPVPLTVIVPPPDSGPLFGLTPVTVGGPM